VGGLLNATFGNATELILALDPTNNADLLMTMNAKLNKLIDSEVGEDVGQMLPGGLEAWRLGGRLGGYPCRQRLMTLGKLGSMKGI
jgi:hypothetical protein